MFSEVYKMMRNAIFLYLDTFFVASIKVYVVLNDNFVTAAWRLVGKSKCVDSRDKSEFYLFSLLPVYAAK